MRLSFHFFKNATQYFNNTPFGHHLLFSHLDLPHSSNPSLNAAYKTTIPQNDFILKNPHYS